MEIDKKEEVRSKLYLKVLNFLSYRKRSTREIYDRLDRYLKKFSLPSREKEEIKESVIYSLKEDGYIKESNDIDFAYYYIDSLKKSGKTLNKIKIYHFLNKRGVPRSIIDGALDKLEPESIYASALSDAQKKLRVLKESSNFLKKKKLLNYLHRKGYPYEISSSVVDTLL